MLAGETFTTRSLPLAQQRDAWSQWFWPTFDIAPRSPELAGFAAENTVWRPGELVVSRVSAPAVRVTRSKAHLRRDPADHWVLAFCQRGRTAIQTHYRTLQAEAGIPYLWSLGEASECERTETSRLQLFLSRDSFHDLAPALDRARGSAINTPMGRLLGDFMLALERELPNLETEDSPRLTAAVRAVVAACVDPGAETDADAPRHVDIGRMERVRRAVRNHLRSPELGPNMLCRTVGMSRSNVYRLLDKVGGVSRYIQHQRLLEAHAMLCDPANTRSISEIAEDLCFGDASTFGRAFRASFGYTPSEARSAGTAGLVPATPLSDRVPAETRHFQTLLRRY